MTSIRIDKFISNNSDYSRSDVRKMLKSKRIKVAGQVIKSADTRVNSDDIVSIDGNRLAAVGDVYLILNKPEGFVCANVDGQNPTVLDLLRNPDNFVGDEHKPLVFKDLQIAGRLDLDTTGMVLITNDGQWNHKVTSPSSACKKTYRVALDREIAAEASTLFAEGVQLDGEKRKTKAAELEVISPNDVRLSLCEGKYHQVKRMFAATGNHVTKLHRESIAGLRLDKTLAPGQFRYLSPSELSTINQNLSNTPTQ